MQLNRIISDRWSPVAFSDKHPTEKELNLLFKAASCAPSSYNAQPWKYMYGVKGKDPVYEILFDMLYDGNKEWAFTVPVLALSIIETVPPGRTSLNKYGWYDTGMSVGNLLAQATSMNIYVHQMGGYDAKRAKQELNLPENHEPGAMMAIGFKGDPSVLPSNIASREDKRSARKDLSEFVFRKPF